jgi:chromosome segregation ATPase
MNCFSPDCENPVAYTFTWGWGAPGACCAEHRVHAQQVHEAQARGLITFAALDPDADKPKLTRDERTQLMAAKMSADQEADEVKARAAQLYNANTDLQAEVRRLRARDAEAGRQLEDRKADLDRVMKERDEALADLHEAQTELERIKMLVPRDEPPASRARL